MSEATLAERETEIIDGWIVDAADGEVLGRADVPDGWRADSEGAVEWALARLAEVDGDLVAVRARRAALLANLDARESALMARRRWWDFRFKAEVIAYARRALGSGKGRTARFAFGSVKFRSTRGSTKITDMDAAVAFVGRYEPDHVRVVTTRTVGVAGLEAAIAAYREANEAEPALPFAERTGPGESVAIETGVGPN